MSANEFFGGGLKQTIQRVVGLGTGAVTTATYAVGATRRGCRIKGIRFYGQSAPTAATLTAEVKARPTSGGTAVTLQSAATNIDFATGAAALAGVAASLTATVANLLLEEDQLLEVTVTAATATAGPGDLTVVVEYEPERPAG